MLIGRLCGLRFIKMGKQKITSVQITLVQSLTKQGRSSSEISKITEIPNSTLYRYLSDENLKKAKQSDLQYYYKNQESCKQKSRDNNKKNRMRNNKRAVEKRRKLRFEVLKHYSKDVPECACCGEKIIEFLTIEHIENNGADHRKTIFPTQLPLWLIKNHFPKGFGVLCLNCNCAKGFFGICPHQKLVPELPAQADLPTPYK